MTVEDALEQADVEGGMMIDDEDEEEPPSGEGVSIMVGDFVDNDVGS